MEAVVSAKLISDRTFRELFPDMQDAILRFVADPSCQCNRGTVSEIVSRLTGKKSIPSNKWKVINCRKIELESELTKVASVGSFKVAVSIDGENAMCVINEEMVD